MPTLRTLECLVALVEQGSMSKAAATLYIATSAVTPHRRIGERTGRSAGRTIVARSTRDRGGPRRRGGSPRRAARV